MRHSSILPGISGERFLDLLEEAAEDALDVFVLGVVSFPCNVAGKFLQIADCEQHFLARRCGPDSRFDALVQVVSPAAPSRRC
jgi:hypothetical protein